jgi:hypothetical protein
MSETTLPELLSRIADTEGCQVYPPAGIPSIRSGHELLPDLAALYRLCSGLLLFGSADYPVRIVRPTDVVPANPVIAGVEGEYDISYEWYIVADDLNGDYITIDLNAARPGRCYDSFWDRHAVRGSCRIVAASFLEFLARRFDDRGGYPYFLRDDFQSLGDAYD